MSSPFQRPQGLGFSTNSVVRLTSNAAALFADGYVKEKRGTLRAFVLTSNGMPTAGTPPTIEIKDGVSGPTLFKVSMYGIDTNAVEVCIPIEVETGLYVSGVSALSGTQGVEVTFIFEERDPAPADQEFPR